ncbi:MAG TPA: helix-turn-helix domain-containing protein [Candidatus Limnocylindria bacterium]|nr:helix-turn-helix domain-containing protein [Candidatus Limnocylindria bacterium]
MALQTRPTGGRPAYDPYRHRHLLYAKAAPVFRAFGYRQVTMKALAHACGVSAPALYRYFPSKLDFALFPLTEPPTGYCSMLLNEAADAEPDGLRALRAALVEAIAHVDLVVLAVRLAIEAGRDAGDVFSSRRIATLDATVREVVIRCVPRLGDRADDLAHTLVSLVVSAAAAQAPLPPEELWRQGGPIVRGYLRDAGYDDAQLSHLFGPMPLDA